MARFAIHLDLTYSRSRDGSTVRSALEQVLASHPEVTGSVGGGGSTVTFDGEAPDRPTAEAFQADAVGAWGVGTRTSGHSAITRVGG